MATRTHPAWSLPPAMAELITAAARCWRAAKDRGVPVQQALHRLLGPRGYGMMTPTLDSLMELWVAAVGRPLVLGQEGAQSADASLLLGLIDGSKSRRKCIDCAAGPASALDCAICSTRIMIGLAREAPPVSA